MHIKKEDGLMIMTESIVCVNYGNYDHMGSNRFEKLNDYEYKCKDCKTVMRFTRTPILIQDNHGRLKIQVVAEPKQ